MHKPLYILSVALFTFSAASTQAQILTKGTRVLGLSLGQLSYQKDDFRTRFVGELHPSAGQFVSDHVALGLTLPLRYGSSRTESNYYNQNQIVKSHTIDIGLLPWLRYYAPSTSRHRVFGELQAGVIVSNYRTRYSDTLPTQRRTDAGATASIGAGYSYFLAQNVGLEALLAYGRGISSGSGGLSMNIGFRVYLPHGTVVTPAQ